MLIKALISIFLFTTFAFGMPKIIVFKGNHAIDNSDLYTAIGLEKPLFFEFWKSKPKIDPKKLDALLPLLENFYKSRGFYHVNIKERILPDKIILDIKEKTPIRIADISLISTLNVKKLLPFKKGDRFSTIAFADSRAAIKRYYADHHYCNVFMDAKAFIDIVTNKAYLVYDITPNAPCKFGTITLHTPKSVSNKIIKSMLYFKEKDPYSSESIRKSYRSIYANEGIDTVIIDDTTHNGNKVPTKVNVSLYPKPIHFKAGLGYSSDERVKLLMGIKHRNFFGNLKTLGLEAGYTQIKRYIKSDFAMPLSNHNRFGSELGYKKEIFDGYHEHSISASATIKHIRMPNYFQESIIVDKITTSSSNDQQNFPDGTITLFSPKISWQMDKRDNILDPHKGYKLKIELMGSIKSFLSDASYYKLYLWGSYIFPLKSAILATKASYGVIKQRQGRIPPSYRFYAGGMNSNRAYAYRQLGPKNSYGDPVGAYSITNISAEYRFPVSKTFRGVLFSDITYLGKDSLPDYQKPYIAVGPGIRYLSPVGPIAFDLGFDAQDFSRFALHFHIGELF